MRLQRYFPSPIAEQALWCLNFANKLPQHKEELELSDDALAGLVADARFSAYALGSWLPGLRRFADSASAAIEQVLHGDGTHGLPVFTPPPLPEGVTPVAGGALDRIFRAAKMAKYRPRCTDAIRADLGLIPASENTNRPVPRFKLTIVRLAEGPAVQIGFSKYGRAGVWVECRRGGGEPEEGSIAVSTPWIDKRPPRVPGQPEMREYRMRYWEDSAPTGEWTDWRAIAVPG